MQCKGKAPVEGRSISLVGLYGWWIAMQGMECTVTTSKEQNQNQNNNLRKWSHKKRQKRQQRSRPVISKIVVHCTFMLATGGQIPLTPHRDTA